MPTVNPAYDPQARMWFLDDPPVEAPTISELLVKLRAVRKRVLWKIENYYPAGVEVRNTADGATALRGTAVPAVIEIPGAGTRPPLRPWNWSPAKEKPDSKTESVPAPRVRGPIVRKWLRRKQFRTWDPDVYEQVLDMWAQGVKGNVIAERLGITPVLVSARMIPNARAHGDPRAVPRMSHCGVKRRADPAPARKDPDTSRSS